MLSPEMLLSRRFVDGVLRKSEFGSRLGVILGHNYGKFLSKEFTT
jgi:hypothetical protein